MSDGQQSPPQRGTKRGRPTGGCPEPVSEKQLGFIADAIGKTKSPDLPGVKAQWNGASLGLQTPEGGKVVLTTGVSPPGTVKLFFGGQDSIDLTLSFPCKKPAGDSKIDADWAAVRDWLLTHFGTDGTVVKAAAATNQFFPKGNNPLGKLHKKKPEERLAALQQDCKLTRPECMRLVMKRWEPLDEDGNPKTDEAVYQFTVKVSVVAREGQTGESTAWLTDATRPDGSPNPLAELPLAQYLLSNPDKTLKSVNIFRTPFGEPVSLREFLETASPSLITTKHSCFVPICARFKVALKGLVRSDSYNRLVWSQWVDAVELVAIPKRDAVESVDAEERDQLEAMCAPPPARPPARPLSPL